MNLSYYAFDWDDNILHMNTLIQLLKFNGIEWIRVDVSTSEFREIRDELNQYYINGIGMWRFIDDDQSISFRNFRDNHDIFLNDVKDSLDDKKYAPAWNKLIDCLENANIFMIITARGHEPHILRSAIEWIIYTELDIQQKYKLINSMKKYQLLFGDNIIEESFDIIMSKYLDLCEFFGVQSQYFCNKFNVDLTYPTEDVKLLAMEYFIERINQYSRDLNMDVSVGFSDDDSKTVNRIYELFKTEMIPNFQNIDFNLYHTLNGECKINMLIDKIL